MDGAHWEHDTEEEFFADYRRATGRALFREWYGTDRTLTVSTSDDGSVIISVRGPTRAAIEAIFDVFEKHVEASMLPEEPEEPPAPQPPPRVFIGHGRAAAWRDLKDHLHEKQGYAVEAYETGARAGHAIRDVLEHMLDASSLAVLVMTGEDLTAEGGVRARQNVVHELGLFQGRLGFSRAIVLFEEGVEEFSNIHGIEQVRFGRGNIKETFGEVLAVLRREFPDRVA